MVLHSSAYGFRESVTTTDTRTMTTRRLRLTAGGGRPRPSGGGDNQATPPVEALLQRQKSKRLNLVLRRFSGYIQQAGGTIEHTDTTLGLWTGRHLEVPPVLQSQLGAADRKEGVATSKTKPKKQRKKNVRLVSVGGSNWICSQVFFQSGRVATSAGHCRKCDDEMTSPGETEELGLLLP